MENGPEKGRNSLADEIMGRANGASEKVRQRVMTNFIPTIEEFGPNGLRWLLGAQNDFSHLARNPDDQSGGGNYKGWSAQEIRELYSVLYDEELEDE